MRPANLRRINQKIRSNRILNDVQEVNKQKKKLELN